MNERWCSFWGGRVAALSQTEFVNPLPSVEATFAEPGTLFILFTQYSTGAA